MSSTKPFTGKTVFWYFIAFFIVITAVLATMVTIAVKTHSGLITEHPYEKGLAYNQVVQGSQQQAELGWKGQITAAPLVDGKTNINFILKNAEGQGVVIDQAYAEISRPTQQGMDFKVPLQADQNGYGAQVQFPANGIWDVRIYAHAGEQAFQTSKRVVIP